MSHTVTLFPRAVDEFTLIEYACNKGHCLCVCVSAGQSHLLCVLAGGQGAVSAESPALLPGW